MTNPAGHAHGPGGLYAEENHHQLGSGDSAHVDEKGQAFKVQAGEKTQLEDRPAKSAPPSPGPGWVSFASWTPSADVTRLSGSWAVPDPPAKNRLEIVFLHIGLNGKSAGQTVFAPIVLQWGKTPYGGGDGWSLACWLQVGSNILVGNYVPVDPGDLIEGEIVHTETESVRQLSMKGTSGSKQATLDFTLSEPLEDELAYGGVLEAYALDMQCSQYPSQPSITFSELRIESADGTLEPAWKATDEVQDCGQETRIKSPSEVEIFFHGAT